MWESPIQMITDDIIKDLVQKQDEWLMESVHRVGFNVDKDELAKALNYDRDQYEKGYSDGRQARDSEIVRCKDCHYGIRCFDVHNGDTDSWVDCTNPDGLNRDVSDDGYCSAGIRRKEDDKSGMDK